MAEKDPRCGDRPEVGLQAVFHDSALR
jgi:hypothetical protein